jgi:hypothetical protein
MLCQSLSLDVWVQIDDFIITLKLLLENNSVGTILIMFKSFNKFIKV